MGKFVAFKDIVGGTIKEFKKIMLDDPGYIVIRDNKKYFLGFTDPQEVYVKEVKK